MTKEQFKNLKVGDILRVKSEAELRNTFGFSCIVARMYDFADQDVVVKTIRKNYIQLHGNSWDWEACHFNTIDVLKNKMEYEIY